MDEKQPKWEKILTILSFILGILSVFFYEPFFFLPILGLILGIIVLFENKKNGLAIAGVVLSGLFTFQLINKNILIPMLSEDLSSPDSSYSRTKRIQSLKTKAKTYGYTCGEVTCTFDELVPSGLFYDHYMIDLEQLTIEVSYHYVENGDGMYGQARYYIEDQWMMSVVYGVISGTDVFLDYRRDYKTGEVSCNTDNCSFAISIANDLFTHYSNILAM